MNIYEYNVTLAESAAYRNARKINDVVGDCAQLTFDLEDAIDELPASIKSSAARTLDRLVGKIDEISKLNGQIVKELK